jgi:hypothetical protein
MGRPKVPGMKNLILKYNVPGAGRQGRGRTKPCTERPGAVYCDRDASLLASRRSPIARLPRGHVRNLNQAEGNDDAKNKIVLVISTRTPI